MAEQIVFDLGPKTKVHRDCRRLTPKQKQRLRPEYRALEAKRRNNKKEALSTRRRHSTPEGWAKNAFHRLKYKTKKFGIEFNLEWRDLIPPKTCPVFGYPFFFNGALQGWTGSPTAPSVDRIDPARGYVKGNISIISLRANVLKRDGSLAEFEQIVAWLKQEFVSSQP